jgi:hypothetical protein
VAANNADILAAATLGTALAMASYQQEDTAQFAVNWPTDGIRFRQQKEGEHTPLQAVESQDGLLDNHPHKL